jgi:hypothetical protein
MPFSGASTGLRAFESSDWMRDFALRHRFDHFVIHGIISFLLSSSGPSAHDRRVDLTDSNFAKVTVR